MEVGLVGLGRMGSNMARRLARGGHHVFVYNRTTSKAVALAREEHGVTGSDSLRHLVSKMAKPRAVWVMLPAGDPTKKAVDGLLSVLSPGDTIVDGGNSHYKDTIRTAKKASNAGVHFVDVGTSGGIWGLKEGYSMMVGGDEAAVKALAPLFETLAPGRRRGWGHVGPAGSGHFVKMVHNGIEYGLMEAYGEGFEILRAKKEFDLDLRQIAEIWRYGSVVRSWLLELASAALKDDQNLSGIKGWVDDSGEGRWTALEAIDQGVAAPVTALSLFMRFASRQDERYADKLLAALRQQFGGHEVKAESGGHQGSKGSEGSGGAHGEG